ncbi:MAG: NADH-quinone oxidoreductase subunit D [Deltaproteobacteria bacterium]|nr:NADH-quinone oxidoreductase subunit D [Deltaproteobacteria bacterium]
MSELTQNHDPLALDEDLPSTGLTQIKLGPSHPATHGTVRLNVTVDGEAIVECIPEIGFLHRGFSKSAENATWHQVLPYTDRLNYVSPILNNVGYIMGVEKLLGVKDTERSQYLRVIGGELSRICDHLTCCSAIGLELGAFTVFLYGVEARELLWDRVSELTGARMTTSWTRVGGVCMDMPADWPDKMRKTFERVMELTNEIDALLSRNRIFIDRTRNIGVISGEEALDWGFTGPALRASGVDYDVRKAHPYLVYDRMDFTVPLGTKGDTYDRYLVRLEEIRQSVKIILQALDQIPPGPIVVDDWRVALPPKKDVFSSIEGVMAHFKLIMEGIQVPAGEVYVYSEGSNGELGFHLVSNGAGKPYAIQVRAPGFPITSALPRLLQGHALADLVPIFDSINMIGGEVEQ